MTRVAVIDYGMGNLRSVAKALEHVCDHKIVVTSDVHEIQSADKIVFPGVGAIRDCMSELHRLDLVDVIRQESQKKPFLGICLGMQALLHYSEENNRTDGLSILGGAVKRFQFSNNPQNTHLKVPHMGWNQVQQTLDHPCWHGIEDKSRFYFVHSYYVQAESRRLVAGSADYGGGFDAALADGSIFAVQFHPEKSQAAGLQLLKNFCDWNGDWAA